MLIFQRKIEMLFFKFTISAYKMFQKLFKMVIVYLLYIVAHYVSANLYQRYCTPLGWFGFITSPFTIASPQCQGLRWVMFNTGNHITAMWMILGAWFINIFITNGPFYDQVEMANQEATRREEAAAAKKAAKKATRRHEEATRHKEATRPNIIEI